MPTKLSTLITRARTELMAPKVATATVKADRFWDDDELLIHAIDGCKGMWREFIDLHEEHFMEIDDAGGVLLPALGTKITGLPKDTFRVVMIEPLDISSTGTYRTLKFIPSKYKSVAFTNARARDTLDPSSGGKIFYALAHQGAPVATPVIHFAPKVSAAVPLRFARIPVLSDLTANSPNPIPGESDKALVAWIVAHARAKERDDRSPDPNWLAIYTNEKKGILVASAPRQEQAATVLAGVFDDEDDDDY